MKRLAGWVLLGIVTALARGVIRRYKPQVVMVTGSVGKTATKDAVALALATRFLVRRSEKSFNSQWGVPFTILGVENPWHDPMAWARVLLRGLALLTLPNHYPALLVLEVGADAPGDIALILKMAKPSAVVVTRLPEVPVHVEAYESPAAVREEEFLPARALPVGAPLIVSADDSFALAFAKETGARITTYGEGSGAHVRLESVEVVEEGGSVVGMRGAVVAGAMRHELEVRGAVGKTQLLPLVAALATASAYHVSVEDALEAFAAYEAPPGRGRLLRGVKGSTLIDDSYNASPAAVEEALANLRIMPAKRRVAILGDMLELGRYSVEVHERAGVWARTAADLVITVGIRAKGIAQAARAAGKLEASVISFEDSTSAALALRGFIEEGDVVLVKGSQSIRMERITEALLADPTDRAKLPRQESAWQRR